MTWMRSRSTSSWILVRACAGTPPESPTKRSTLRPAMVVLRSFKYWTSARSMSMPPEASGPVFTVIRPTRIGPLCPRTAAGKPSAEAPSPAAWMKRLRVNVMGSLLGRDSVGRVLRCVGLLEWLRAVEGLDFHAFPENAYDRGHAVRADVEKLRAENLGRQTDVGDSRRIAVAEAACFLFPGEVRFQRLQGLQRPVREPLVARRLVLMHFAPEVAADARNDQRMPVAHDDLREPANSGPAAGILRQQRRPGMGFLEVFEDRHRLEQRRTAVDDERGHHALRVDRLVFLGVLLSLQQIDRDLLDLYPLESEGRAHAVSGQRPPESVEFHGHRLAPLNVSWESPERAHRIRAPVRRGAFSCRRRPPQDGRADHHAGTARSRATRS